MPDLEKPSDLDKSIFNKGKLTLLLALAALILILLILAIFLKSLLDAEPNVQAAVISFIGAVVGVLYTNFKTQTREIKSRHFIEKKTAYMKLIDLTFETLEATRKKVIVNETDMVDRMVAFKKDLLVWGDQEVIKAYMEFENFSSNNENSNPNELLFVVDDLYRAIRKDLGHNDNNLQRGSFIIMQIIANDRHLLEQNR